MVNTPVKQISVPLVNTFESLLKNNILGSSWIWVPQRHDKQDRIHSQEQVYSLIRALKGEQKR